MNWKVLVEPFLKGYHIRTTHRDTFYPLQYNNLDVVETSGRTTGSRSPTGRPHHPDRPSEWNVEQLTYVLHLFPNVMVATSGARCS